MSPAFETICELGRGGMGSVRLVRLLGPEEFGRLCVLKRLREDRNDEEAALRFAYEGQVASVIRHANVVQTHHVGQDEQGLFLVLDYVEGASLEQLLAALARSGSLAAQPIALRIALDILSGLSAVHDARDLSGTPLGVLHRDVTLQNILIGVDGVSRLADFGIAKTRSSPVVTDQAYVLGKLRFLAPEYVRREEVTAAIDVYSLGVSLWHALTGKVLWRQANEAELIEHVMLDSVPPVSTYVDVPPVLDAIVRKACARDPQARYVSARELADALEASGLPIATHTEAGELIQRVFARELAERRRQIAEVTGRARRYEPKVPSANVPPEPSAKRKSGGARPWLLAAAAGLVACAALAALELRADAKVASVAVTPIAPQRVTPLPAPPSPPETSAVPSAAAHEPAPVRAAPRRPVRAPGALVKKNPYRD